MQKSGVIKFETDKIIFVDIHKNRVSLKLSEITSIGTSGVALFVPIVCLISGIFPFAMFFAARADGHEGYAIISLITFILTWTIGIILYLKLPPSKKYLTIGTRGNSRYFINCGEENLNSVIQNIENRQRDLDNN